MTIAMACLDSHPSANPPLLSEQAAGQGAVTVDEQAMGELWQTHGAALRRFALKLTLGDRQRAEDIVQDTLLRAWRHPEIVGSGRDPIRPWLFTVSRRIAIDLWRSRARLEAAEEVLDERHSELPDETELIERTVDALDVRAALAKLSPEHRQVIREMYFNGNSAAETARILGIPEGTVKSRSYYALRTLRRTAFGLRAASQRPGPS